MPFEKAAAELSIPERKLTTLSFCEPTPRHLQKWVNHLPMVNLGEASRLLYHAITELNQLIIEPDVRLKLTEIIRPSMLFVCNSLGKHYLNKPVFLPKKAFKVSRLASALDNQLAIAYKIIIFEIASGPNATSRKGKKILLPALERALGSLSNNVLRAHQLYSSPAANSWHEMHQLYLIAEANQALDIAIPDEERHYLKKSSIADTYKRVLMLGCCRTNQLRQADIRQIYETTELWSQHMTLGPVTETSAFVVDISGDKPPTHVHLNAKKQSPFLRGMDFTQLLTHLSNYLAQPESNLDAFAKGITVPKTIDRDILRHLTSAWHSPTDRAHSRLPSDKPVTLCIGFSASHYYASGGVDFEAQLKKELDELKIDSNGGGNKPTQTFTGRDVTTIRDYKDVWANSFDARNREFIDNPDHVADPIDYRKSTAGKTIAKKEFSLFAKENNNRTSHPIHHAQLVDVSPTGYCIRWKDDIPKEIKAGEAVAVNEGAGRWSIGIIRWIRQVSASESLMGVELLAPGAIPCAAKVITRQKKKSDYMRALLVPAPPSGRQPASLITPNLPFKPGVQVILNQHGELTHGQLIGRMASLGNFTQFVFEAAEPSIRRGEESDDNIEDIWPDI